MKIKKKRQVFLFVLFFVFYLLALIPFMIVMFGLQGCEGFKRSFIMITEDWIVILYD